jgi:type IV pilus assembly protein PilE
MSIESNSRRCYGRWRGSKNHAFTILELVIALAIAAILAAYAMPSYWAHMARGYRIEAVAAVYRAAQYAEANVSTAGMTLSGGFDQSPPAGAAVYRLRILPKDDSNGGYAVEAKPVDTGPMRDDPCGIYRLDATGAQTNRSFASNVPSVSDCWRGAR